MAKIILEVADEHIARLDDIGFFDFTAAPLFYKRCTIVSSDVDIPNLSMPNGVNNGAAIMRVTGEYYAESNGETVEIEIGGRKTEFDFQLWFAPLILKKN